MDAREWLGELSVSDVIGGALGVIGTVLGLLLIVAVVSGSFVEKSNCLVKQKDGTYKVHSQWKVHIADSFLNPAVDTATCVNNIPAREGLSAMGIWPLGSPEHQLAEHAIGQ